MRLIKKIVLLFLFLGFVFFSTSNVYASCSVTSTSFYLTPNSDVNIDTVLNNLGGNPLTWIKIPSNYSSVLSVTSPTIQEAGWTLDESTGDFIFTGGSLEANSSVHINLTLHTGDVRPMGLTWSVSENSNGDPTEACSDLNIEITNTPPTPTPAPSISNTRLSVNNNSATLTWTTDLDATGVVNYGTSVNYGATATTSLGTSHSATLSPLTSSTTYHYQIQVSGAGGTTTTTDASLTTSAANVTTTTTVTNTVTTTIQNVVTKILKDTTPPRISLTTDFSKSLKEAGTIVGIAQDSGIVNAGIASIDYSIDGGKNWLPVNSAENLGSKKVSFDFFPNIQDDGNYTIMVKAKDLTGNIAKSKAYTMIIDRLPPLLGGSLFLIGPLNLIPDINGSVYTISNLPLNLTVSAVGGPLSIDLYSGSEKFNLQKNLDSGLWSGDLIFSKEGVYSLTAKSIDGGNNQTEKKLNNIIVLPSGKITDQTNKPLDNVKVTVYTYNKSTDNYIVWEAGPYSQTNPQQTNKDGNYHFVLPSGKYYLEIYLQNYVKIRTEIFDTNSISPINQNFILQKSNLWSMWWTKTIPFIPSVQNTDSAQSSLIGKSIPNFDLSTKDSEFSNISVLGKPTIITFFASWDPKSTDQIFALDQFKKENDGVNTYAVALQESKSKTNIFKKVGGYDLPIISDPDGLFVELLSLQSLPTHIFLDKKGIIKTVNNRFLTKDDLLKEILK